MMKISLSTQLKAVFLLVVFTLSTLVSFACAVGFDMGYNKDHHKVQAHSSAAEHSEIGHKHSKNVPHKYATVDHRESPSHTVEITHHDKLDEDRKESTPDDCCRDEAAKFEKSDKVSPQTPNYSVQSLVITLTIKPYFHLDAVTAFLHTPNSRYFIRNHHPPIADTRIAIQSFLI